ncbi:16S rRNA (uracil(1498)-N(3))-methyltransferase [Actinophytocola gossypii]|uniref:Ribosomal RNA small subunit methyltransferase E n=1 Tax=Actinophytocola gossypii TaxID=2812003 RepID=A0ABT2JAM0_9PSEU|nr:16S rRNA (uracil(1498)-N(3))-methyltransferase [Actinophytocola gossypii]MCT2584924.1 16S rRNA (uracil(1498)-N(3))-methyltransferase [Actinophytocola gossypii]
MTAPVFLVPELPSGTSFVLDGPEGRHAAAVRRLGPGEDLVVADGRGGAAACVVASVQGRTALTLTVSRRWQEPEPTPRVVLAQALVKGDRGELAVELATECGVDAVVPWRASRCVARWDDGPRGEKALARWRSTAREAAKQSRRARVPDVAEPVSTAELAALVADAACALVLDSRGSAPLAEVPLPETGDVVVVTGPEGGISDHESEALVAAGAQVVRLGPTVLRASTAGAAALAALGVRTGRWR